MKTGVFTASSGNSLFYEIKEAQVPGELRTGITSIWRTKPSELDTAQAIEYLAGLPECAGSAITTDEAIPLSGKVDARMDEFLLMGKAGAKVFRRGPTSEEEPG